MHSSFRLMAEKYIHHPEPFHQQIIQHNSFIILCCEWRISIQVIITRISGYDVIIGDSPSLSSRIAKCFSGFSLLSLFLSSFYGEPDHKSWSNWPHIGLPGCMVFSFGWVSFGLIFSVSTPTIRYTLFVQSKDMPTWFNLNNLTHDRLTTASILPGADIIFIIRIVNEWEINRCNCKRFSANHWLGWIKSRVSSNIMQKKTLENFQLICCFNGKRPDTSLATTSYKTGVADQQLDHHHHFRYYHLSHHHCHYYHHKHHRSG